MANKRMIFTAIYHSKKFLSLPASTRDFYTYLTLSADDDGVCNVFRVARMMANSNYQGDLHLLMEAGYIMQLDSTEEIYYLIGWQRLHKIKSIYKVDSDYIDLLRAAIPDLPIAKSSQQLRREKQLAKIIDDKKREYGADIYIQDCDMDV